MTSMQVKRGDISYANLDPVVNLSQIRTIDKKRLISPKLGTLSNDSMKMVDDALKNSLALY